MPSTPALVTPLRGGCRVAYRPDGEAVLVSVESVEGSFLVGSQLNVRELSASTQ